MRHIVLLSGKDSLAALLVQLDAAPHLPYEIVNNQVGWDLPETIEWIARVEKHICRAITICGDDLTEICYEQNCLPIAGIRRFCTKYAKIKPLNEYLGRTPATLYFGLRADEADRSGYSPPSWQTVVYPLRDRGIGIGAVWSICESLGLLPPAFHWGWMENRVRTLLAGDDFLLDQLPEWQRRVALAWRSRPNCDRCPYQRQYEWIGLSEHHSDLFSEACDLERRLCHRQEFTWVRGFRLPELLLRAPAIKERRAHQVVVALRAKQQGLLFSDDSRDELDITSCGLFCGK